MGVHMAHKFFNQPIFSYAMFRFGDWKIDKLENSK